MYLNKAKCKKVLFYMDMINGYFLGKNSQRWWGGKKKAQDMVTRILGS